MNWIKRYDRDLQTVNIDTDYDVEHFDEKSKCLTEISNRFEQLEKEFYDKFKKGLYPYINGAHIPADIWDWIKENFIPKVNIK